MEIEQLEDSEALASWAQQALPLKNQLSKADAQAVEEAFSAKMSRLGNLQSAAPKDQKENGYGNQSFEIDAGKQTVNVICKPVRERDREHLKFVASQPCLICGRAPSDPHHIKFAEQLAMGRKVNDRFTVPICRLHHRELHRKGNERAWWEKQEIDPLPAAASLWAKTHAVSSAAINIDGENAQPAEINGAGTAGWSQNDETKPIFGPEAE